MGYLSSLHVSQHKRCLHPPLPRQEQTAPKCPGCKPSKLSPGAARRGRPSPGVPSALSLPPRRAREGGAGAAGSPPPAAWGLGPGSGERGEERPPAPRRGLGGRAGAGAAGSPSDGEMWPFTFTLQCQHLNHCRSARAQGCSGAAANKAAAGPPPPAAGKARGGDARGPSAVPLPSSPPPFRCLLFILALFVVPRPVSGTRLPQCPLPTHQEPQV